MTMLRQQKEISQSALAQRTGVDQASISRWESKGAGSVRTVLKLIEGLGVELDLS